MKQKGSIIYVSYTSAKEKEEAFRYIDLNFKHKRIIDNGCVLEVILNEVHRDFVDLDGLKRMGKEKAERQAQSREYYRKLKNKKRR